MILSKLRSKGVPYLNISELVLSNVEFIARIFVSCVDVFL